LPGRFLGHTTRELTADVREPELRLRSRVLEPDHAGETALERHGDVALDVVRAHALGLRDDLDERWQRIRIRIDVEPLERESAGNDRDKRQREDDQRRLQCGCYDTRDQLCGLRTSTREHSRKR